MITRVTPFPSHASTVAGLRMPPPSCTGIDTASRMRSTAAAFIGLPAKAPSRSTTCRYSKPCASNAWAWPAGSRLNTVARAMSPCSRRTHRPSLRSMAGKRITCLPTPACRSSDERRLSSRFPLEEIGDHLEPEPLALLGMELGAGIAVARHHGGEGTAVVGLGHQIGAALRLEVVGVHEIGVQPFGSKPNAVQQRVRAAFVQRVPAHMRDFQARVGRCDAIDLAG